jgi:uncharacterized membrane protein
MADVLMALARWIHIFAGIVWIGLLYFFNFVNGPFQGTIDGETKKKVNPELLPRALYFFRWGAAWTWFTGVLLLFLVFYHGGIMFDAGKDWSMGAGVMVAASFLAAFAYDALAKSGFAKNPKTLGTVGFIGAAIVLVLMATWGELSYRAFNIHMGVMFGTIMAFNVWFRIWPAQQKIITAVKAGTAPDAALVALAGSRSRHNTYLSAPLVWAMVNQHTTMFSGGGYGIPGEWAFVVFLVVILVGWHLVWQLYKRAGKVKGF